MVIVSRINSSYSKDMPCSRQTTKTTPNTHVIFGSRVRIKRPFGHHCMSVTIQYYYIHTYLLSPPPTGLNLLSMSPIRLVCTFIEPWQTALTRLPSLNTVKRRLVWCNSAAVPAWEAPDLCMLLPAGWSRVTNALPL